MKVVTSRAQVRAQRAGLGTLGLVPTMGYLHEGHLSLVERARRECGAVAVSVFVNPRQFGPHEDLDAYPRDLDRDLALLASAGADLVWTPSVEDVYPPGFATTVQVQGVSEVLEGASRPGHFAGVATVVAILLAVVGPQRAYFGQKDAQQTVVLRRMVADLGLDVDVVVAPTVREPDGLALSSRNTYLTPDQRRQAPVLHRALVAAAEAWASGEGDADALRALMRRVLAGAPDAVVDYVSVADPDDLTELGRVDPARGALASLAVRVGRPRLIDNLVLEPHA